jgi:hypothetical protein
MLNELEKKAVDHVVDLVRVTMEKSIGGVDREMTFEIAAALVVRELRMSDPGRDIKEGAVVFFHHRLLDHGGNYTECNRCLEFGARAFRES